MKMTQKQLEEAYEQMRQEREQDDANARRAVEWIEQQLGSDCRWRVMRQNMAWVHGAMPTPVSPWNTMALVAIHETYGPSLKAWTDWLDTQPWARNTGHETYTVDTPFGSYNLLFEYFDNHCTGY